MGQCTIKKQEKYEKSTQDRTCSRSKETQPTQIRISIQQAEQLQNGEPTIIQNGIKIVLDPVTKKLKGVPREWIGQYNLPFEVDNNEVVSTKNLPSEIKPEDQLPQTILKLVTQKQITFIKSDSQQKSEPPESQINLQVAKNQEYGIKNLTEELKNVLQFSKITSKEAKKNPQALIQMLNTYNDEVLSKQTGRHYRLMTMKDFENKMQSVQFIERNPSKQYDFDKELGKGACCKVFTAHPKDDPSSTYAVRIMKVKDQKKLEKIKRQIAVMQLCGAHNIVNYYFSFYYKYLLFMFVQYMNQGSLTDFIFQYIERIPENVIAYILKEVLIGLCALHSRRQIHRDLKSDNILINSRGQVKIADFGFAIQLTKQKENRVSLVGTPAWMAPQLIQKQKYDEAVDIWSLGMVAMQLCYGQPPFLEGQQFRTMFLIVSSEAPKLKGFSNDLTEFVDSCLQKDPKNRASAFELLQHPFIKKIGNGERQKAQMRKMLQQRLNI